MEVYLNFKTIQVDGKERPGPRETQTKTERF